MTTIEEGEVLFAQGKIEEAEKCFFDLLENDPTNAETLNNLGVIQHTKGNIHEAEDFLLKALAAKEDYLEALLNLVDLYQNAKRWKEASVHLEKCLERGNKDPKLFNQLGTIYLEMGEIEKARVTLKRSLELNSDQQIVADSLRALEKKGSTPKIEISEKPLNILFVQEAPCIRNYKMATALRSRGHRVSLAYTKARLSQMYKGLSDDVYTENIQIGNFRQLWDISKNYDIVHCHNEPDILTVAALAGDAPVVHDTHDLISLRANGDPNLSYFEGVANRGATGRVYTTLYQLEEAQKLYGANGPSLVFCNYVSESDLPKCTLPKRSARDGKVHIVYEGGIGGSGHRDFFSLFIALAKMGVQLHIYPTFFDKTISQAFSSYPDIHYNHPVSPKNIIETMTQYDLGIIPFNLEKGNQRFLDSTIANKLFEYLAAGLPVLTSPLKSYIQFFKENPVGVTFIDAPDIIKAIPKLKAIGSEIDLSGYVFTYENEVERLEEFYRTVVDNGSRKVQGAADEATRAREHWQRRGVIGYYFEEGPQSIGIVNAVKKLREHEDIESVLEFGCNVGRNLNCLRRDVGGLRLLGIDINQDAVNVGREHYQLPLLHGGEEKLNEIQDGAYDAVFTVSVLDHIPNVEAVLRELLRISKKYFIAIEPYTGSNEDARKYAVADYSYFWDYPALFAKIGAVIVHDQAYPISDQGLGPFYHLYIVRPVQRQNERESKQTIHQIADDQTNLTEPNAEQGTIKRQICAKEKEADFYDELFLAGGWQKEYHKPYTEALCYKIWKKALEWVERTQNPKIIEIGCGPGQFANALFDSGIYDYRGIDFSPVAVRMAKENNRKHPDAFKVDNAYTSEIFTSEYNIVVLLEVLEHIADDLQILDKIRRGAHVIFSVPNYYSDSHMRWFNSKDDIYERYGDTVDIKSIYVVSFRPTQNKIYLVKSVRK